MGLTRNKIEGENPGEDGTTPVTAACPEAEVDMCEHEREKKYRVSYMVPVGFSEGATGRDKPIDRSPFYVFTVGLTPLRSTCKMHPRMSRQAAWFFFRVHLATAKG